MNIGRLSTWIWRNTPPSYIFTVTFDRFGTTLHWETSRRCDPDEDVGEAVLELVNYARSSCSLPPASFGELR